jgi:hypothetical protein
MNLSPSTISKYLKGVKWNDVKRKHS